MAVFGFLSFGRKGRWRVGWMGLDLGLWKGLVLGLVRARVCSGRFWCGVVTPEHFQTARYKGGKDASSINYKFHDAHYPNPHADNLLNNNSEKNSFRTGY